MGTSLWYYSRDDELKRGPVTSSELHRLAFKRKLGPDDLVWCHGMEQWVPARTIRGIFPEDDDAGLLTDIFEAPEPAPREAAEEEPQTEKKPDSPPGLDRVSWYDRPIHERPNQNDANTEQLGQVGSRAVDITKQYGRWVMVASLLVIVMGRGCDRIGQHHVERQQAAFDLVQIEFNSKHEKKIANREQRILDLRTRANITMEESQELRNLQNDLVSLQNSRALELSKFQDDAWHSMRYASQSAKANFAIWSYYRQLLFFVAMLALVAGCFARFYVGDVFERILSIGLLAIVALSVVLGGLPLFAS